MPMHLAAAGSLVGAAIDDMKHEELDKLYDHPREYQNKCIYPDEQLQWPDDDPWHLFNEAEWSLKHFFPPCSDLDTLAYDCLPKTVNQALGFLFFSHRSQVIRLMQLHHRITRDQAIALKSRGGVAIQALTNFAIHGNETFSFKRIAQFSLRHINGVNAWRRERGLSTKSPGRVIADFAKDLILVKETHKQLVLVFHGNVDFDFAHAACFVRTHNYRNMKQMLLLDCKNKTPIVCPRLGADQMEFEESLKIKEDVEASYYKWEIYALEKRMVKDETERRRLHNRMMYVLSGEEKYQNDSRAIGLAIVHQKRQMRKRKRGAKGFVRRKDHALNEKKKKRRASAQKAEVRMESVNEQALMAGKVLKEGEDAPIDEVEVSNEEAEAALLQGDDQGSDYNIDEYLDATSKHSLITFAIL